MVGQLDAVQQMIGLILIVPQSKKTKDYLNQH